MTLFSAASLLVGGSWAWLLQWQGGPEALGAIIPLLIVGGIHLITGPVAIFQAFRLRKRRRCVFVYAYFGLFLIATVLVFPPDILTYVVMFLFLTSVPILIALVARYFSKSNDAYSK